VQWGSKNPKVLKILINFITCSGTGALAVSTDGKEGCKMNLLSKSCKMSLVFKFYPLRSDLCFETLSAPKSSYHQMSA